MLQQMGDGGRGCEITGGGLTTSKESSETPQQINSTEVQLSG